VDNCHLNACLVAEQGEWADIRSSPGWRQTCQPDRKGFEEWRATVVPIIEQNGGRFLVRSDRVEVLEGDLRLTNVAVIEFPDRATLGALP
jgi:hypothetical protein